MGAKKTELLHLFLLVCVFFVATYGNEVVSVSGHKKTQTYGTVHAFRSTVVQNRPLRTRCAQSGLHFQISN